MEEINQTYKNAMQLNKLILALKNIAIQIGVNPFFVLY